MSWVGFTIFLESSGDVLFQSRCILFKPRRHQKSHSLLSTLSKKMFIHHCSVFSFFLRRSVNLPRIRLDMKSLISLWGKLLNTTNAVAFENSRFSSPEEKRMFSQASCKLSFPPSPLAHAFSWGSLLSVSLLASFIARMPMGQVLLAYSYFEKGCRIKCTRQPRKVLWAVLSSLFFKEIWKNGKRGPGHISASAKGKQQK